MEFSASETKTVVVGAKRASSSLRKLTLTGDYGLVVRSFKIGDRELLQSSDPVPAEIFFPERPETFDVPVEASVVFTIVIENTTMMRTYIGGYLLGMREKR
jgi:hypothetical protein